MNASRKTPGSFNRFTLIFAACFSLLCRSGDPIQTTGGSGTDAPNAVVVISESGALHGRAPHGCRLTVYASEYIAYNDSGFSTRLAVGEEKTFILTGLQTGRYTVIASDADGAFGVLFREVNVNRTSQPDTLIDTLAPTSTVYGAVALPSGIPAASLPVFIRGTGFSDTTDAHGRFAFFSVPQGEYRIQSKIVAVHLSGTDLMQADSTFSINRGEELDIGNLWMKQQQ